MPDRGGHRIVEKGGRLDNLTATSKREGSLDENVEGWLWQFSRDSDHSWRLRRRGETYSARKSYAREMREVSIYSVARPSKTIKREKLTITFSDEDYEGVYLPHSDALVVTMVAVNHKINRVLVDNGSSTDILYKSAFDLMKISREKVYAVRFPLVGFVGEQVIPLGSIELQVTVGTPAQKTIPVKFLIVDQPSAYNAIFGRTAQAELKAVTSIPHLSMKFPTEDGVGVVRGEQKAARKCYNISLGHSSQKPRPDHGADPSDK